MLDNAAIIIANQATSIITVTCHTAIHIAVFYRPAIIVTYQSAGFIVACYIHSR